VRQITRDLSRSLYRFARLAWPHLEVPGGSAFRPNWHLRVLCDLLESFHARTSPRDLVINVPPATGKSLFSGVLFPAWVWTSDPSHRFIYASYDSALLHRDAEILLGLLRSRWYRETFGDVIRPGPIAVGNFELRGGGGRLSTSIRGAVTGWHAHTLIVDDPNKAQDVIRSPSELEFAWQAISTAFSNRTIDPATFGRLLIGQRLAVGDPFERAVEAGWERHAFPMVAIRDAQTSPIDTREEGEILFPARFPASAVSTLEEGMRLLGTWEAQYQQRPVTQGSGAILAEWIQTIPRSEVPRDAVFVQSWDLTFKGKDASDWIAGQWWARTRDDRFILLDAVFRRASFVETLSEIMSHREAWPASRILIEDAANGPGIEDVLREEIGGLELVSPEGSKEARAVAVTPLWRAGRVFVVEGPHVARIRREWPKFPRMDRDDEIDAMSQALRYLSRGAGYSARLMAILRGANR
jgi:predicted phage terminase large subunit-like protein